MTLPLIGHRYALHEQLGAGGMGAVFRATDRLTGGTVALKRVTIPDRLQFNSRAADTVGDDLPLALAQEFQLLALLRHPNIISVLDYGFDDSASGARVPYYTMPLLENARTLIEAGRDQPFLVQIDLINQLLQALRYLHRRGILHRDLKPANVLVVGTTPDLQVKVLDFGLALTFDRADGGDMAGTLAYMAPEILRGGAASPSSDLYAAGLMLYELLAGQHPFHTEDVTKLVSEILAAPPDHDLLLSGIMRRLDAVGNHDASALDTSTLPAAVAHVVGRLVAKYPDERYADAAEAMTALHEASNLKAARESEAIRDSFLQSARFVGREAELERLTEALDGLRQGKGAAFLVRGESGVGKSRLLDELRIRALVAGALLLRGQGLSSGALPYQLWRDPLRRLALTTPVDDAQAVILKALIPDLGALIGRDVADGGELPSPDAEPDDPRVQALIEAVMALFRRQSTPVVLIMDDVQWGGEGVPILKRLSALAGELPLLLIAGYREEEYPELAEELAAMQTMTLKRLPPDEIAQLSESMLGAVGREPEVVELLQRETEGNAFFLVEVVRALAEEAGALTDVGRKTLPERVFAGGVQQVIRRRLNAVPRRAYPLLKLAAVAGRQIDLALLRAAVPRADLQKWLTICADAAVLEAHEDRWRFAHDMLRETVLADLTDDERPVLHRQIALAIEKVYPNDPARAAVLLEHWHIAGDKAKEQRYAEQVAG